MDHQCYANVAQNAMKHLSALSILLSEKAHFVIVRAASRWLYTVEMWTFLWTTRCERLNVCSASSSIICSKTKQKRCLTLDG